MRSWPAENLATCHVWGGSNKNCRCHMSPIKTKECVFKKKGDPTIPLCLAQFELVVLSFLFSTPVKTRGDKRMGQVGQSTQNVRDSVHTKTGWWLTYPSEKYESHLG